MCGLVAQQIHLAAKQRIHRGTRAGVRHRGQLGTHLRHEQQTAQMRHSAQPGIGQRHLVLVDLDVSLKLFEVIGRKVFAPQQRHGHINYLADVLEVLQRVKLQFFVKRGRGGHAHVVDEDGVAIGGGARHFGGSNRATRAHRVLYQHGLPQRFAHGNGDHAGHHVSGAACRKGHHQADGPVGKNRLGKCRGTEPCGDCHAKRRCTKRH